MPYKEGDEILRCAPFVTALKVSVRSEYCDYCFRHKESGHLRCGGCERTYFCDKKCQSRSWKDIHKFECQYLQSLNDKRIVPDSLLIIIRIIFKLKNGGRDIEVQLPNGKRRKFENLMSHREDVLSCSQKREILMTYRIILKNTMTVETNPKFDELVDIFGKILVNTCCITVENGSIGWALFLGYSALDHSCRPNAVGDFLGRDLVVTSIKPSESFDDVRVSYIDNTLSKVSRKKILLERFFFDCNCEACIETPSGLEPLESQDLLPTECF